MKESLINGRENLYFSFGILGGLLVLAFSIVSWVVSYQLGLTTVYNDSMSHLNLSRFVFDNMEPGFAQLGGVWLPVSHVLALPLIWNDWAWHSGFAGSLPSMISYLVSVFALFNMVLVLTRSRISAIVGAAVLALNLNYLFLQTTALTEPLYLCFFVLSSWAYVKYVVGDNPRYLILMGLFGFLQVLTRYDGWFVIGLEALLVGAFEWGVKRRGIVEGLSKIMMFALPAGFGVLLWLLWNYLIFNDLFFFALGPFSAHSQQTDIQNKAGLITKNNIFIASLAYWYAITNNVGLLITISGIVGAISYFFIKLKEKMTIKILVVIFLLTPIIFNILALFLGFSVLNIPELNWNRSSDPSGSWFNVRYGILALPFFAVFVGILARSLRTAGILLLIIVALQASLMMETGLITVVDGTIGSSSFDNYDTGYKLKELVQPGEKVLLSTSFFNSVAFVSNLPLNTFVHEGVSSVWSRALEKPQEVVKWVVLANGDTGEAVYNSVVKRNNEQFLRNYKLEYSGKHAYIFRRKTIDEIPVSRDGKKLVVGGEEFKIKGVNAYDLTYLTEDQIKNSFSQLNQAGVNTVRFWAFGDGLLEGFQSTAGQFNEERFKNMDLVIAQAGIYKIKLIPTLINNWPEYGGKEQYLKWLGKDPKNSDEFFTSPEARDLYKNYVNKVVSRENTLTHISYKDDPTILAWDLMNESRFDKNPQAVIDWTSEMAQFIKSKDSNHLVTSGTERLLPNSNENHAVNICGIEYIDICSVHLYLFDKDKVIFENPEQVSQFLEFQKNESDSKEKPMILGEWGVAKNKNPYNMQPLEVLKQIISLTRDKNYNGFLIWNWSEKNDDSFGFSPQGVDGNYKTEDLKKLIN